MPGDVRKRLGPAQGGMVYGEETEGGVVLRTVPQIVAQAQALAQALAKRYVDMPGSSVAGFLAGRVNESGE